MQLNDNGLLNIVKISGADIAEMAQAIVAKAKDGETNPLEVKLKLKALESIIKDCAAYIDPLAREEAEKYGSKSFKAMGAKVELAETGTKYDYSECNDLEYSKLLNESMVIEAQLKAREMFLKSLKSPTELVNKDTGETWTANPPVKKSTSSLKISFI